MASERPLITKEAERLEKPLCCGASLQGQGKTCWIPEKHLLLEDLMGESRAEIMKEYKHVLSKVGLDPAKLSSESIASSIELMETLELCHMVKENSQTLMRLTQELKKKIKEKEEKSSLPKDH